MREEGWRQDMLRWGNQKEKIETWGVQAIWNAGRTNRGSDQRSKRKTVNLKNLEKQQNMKEQDEEEENYKMDMKFKAYEEKQKRFG